MSKDMNPDTKDLKKWNDEKLKPYVAELAKRPIKEWNEKEYWLFLLARKTSQFISDLRDPSLPF